MADDLPPPSQATLVVGRQVALSDDEAIAVDLIRMGRRERGEVGRSTVQWILSTLTADGLTVAEAAVTVIGLIYSWHREAGAKSGPDATHRGF